MSPSVPRPLSRLGHAIPVFIIMAIVVWSYYAFVVSLSHSVPTEEIRTFYLIVYHIAFVLFVVSYTRAVLSDPGKIPPQFYLTPAEKEQLDRVTDPGQYLEEVASRLPVHETTMTLSVRYCEVCVCIKPDRSHHCSVCERCILKMDHHCPWINNCVGFRNYKFFNTFLLFAWSYCLTISMCVAPWAVFLWNRQPEMDPISEIDKFNVMVVFFIASMFFLAVSSLWFFHMFLTAKNKSTLEMGRSARFRDEETSSENPYDIGCRSNCTEVYGTGPLMVCPVYTTKGNGVLFPRDHANRNSGDTRRLLSTNGIYNSDEESGEEMTLYDGNIALNLDPAA